MGLNPVAATAATDLDANTAAVVGLHEATGDRAVLAVVYKKPLAAAAAAAAVAAVPGATTVDGL